MSAAGPDPHVSRVALVTGAASGIGLSASRLLAERGADVAYVSGQVIYVRGGP